MELDSETGLAVGSGGAVFRRGAEGRTREATPSGATLKVAVDVDDRGEVTVGTDGTVLER
ncbi:MAG: hypothetical protein ABEJ73_00510 [Haloplanus sp.]